MWFGWIFWIVIFGIVIWLVLTLTGKISGGTGPESALDILKRRYAEGEISKEEFEEKKKDLLD
jgi:putative membrane protein